MQLVLDDLLCPTCTGYVHPFLERCPACGSERESRYGDALAEGGLGAAELLESEATRGAVRSVVVRYFLKTSGDAPDPPLHESLTAVAGALTYHAAVAADAPTSALPAGSATAESAALGATATALSLRVRPSDRSIAEIPLGSILAATPISKRRPPPAAWVGANLRGRRILERRPLAEANLLVTFGTPEAAGQLALENRRGLFAPSARQDHYAILARWIGLLGAATAEARWTAIGAAAHAAELGLGSPAAPAPSIAAGEAAASTAGQPGPGETAASTAADTPGQGIRAALEELEDLRAAGLVSAGEYAAKREQILARL